MSGAGGFPAKRAAAADKVQDVRGYLASKLHCWHRLTGEESDQLVALFEGQAGQPGSVYPKQQPTGWVDLTDKQVRACVDASYFHTAWSSDLDVPMLVANLSKKLKELNT